MIQTSIMQAEDGRLPGHGEIRTQGIHLTSEYVIHSATVIFPNEALPSWKKLL